MAISNAPLSFWAPAIPAAATSYVIPSSASCASAFLARPRRVPTTLPFSPLSRARCLDVASFSSSECGWQRGSPVRENWLRTWQVHAGPNEGTGPEDSELGIEEVEARLGVGSKKKSPKRQGDGVAASAKSVNGQKGWNEMTMPEKAWSLYIGEKGVLFWINKLAYIFIFVIAGGWVAFRFVGPALGLYQLEGDVLPPTKIFVGN